MPNRIFDLTGRTYPQTWLLVDALSERPRLLGQEVVDLSPGAIELRSVARELRRFAETRDNWQRLGERSKVRDLPAGHRRTLSFGPEIHYYIEHDERGSVNAGRPFRHLVLALEDRVLTPATSAEIGLYFYGRRRAAFARTGTARAHGFIGLAWEELEDEDLNWLLEREMKLD